eukprot:TRINITY_DN7192_c0_g2_i2.p1 TRINITY_DN7192_c0_g2~~TRINITY_DN7192_c0_g2_i2.p1  ORF type:complete len:128 (-),score=8.43 TRINITY_DN7192_c0_g2_i2:285-668(-)
MNGRRTKRPQAWKHTRQGTGSGDTCTQGETEDTAVTVIEVMFVVVKTGVVGQHPASACAAVLLHTSCQLASRMNAERSGRAGVVSTAAPGHAMCIRLCFSTGQGDIPTLQPPSNTNNYKCAAEGSAW